MNETPNGKSPFKSFDYPEINMTCSYCNGNGYLGEIPPIEEKNVNPDDYEVKECNTCEGSGYLNKKQLIALVKRLEDGNHTVQFSLKNDVQKLYVAKINDYYVLNGNHWIRLEKSDFTKDSPFNNKEIFKVMVQNVTYLREVPPRLWDTL